MTRRPKHYFLNSSAALTATVADPESYVRPIRPHLSVLTHPVLALAAVLLVLMLGLPLVWLKGRPAYYTESSIYVAPHFLKNLEVDQEFELPSNTQYRQFVQQQMRTVNRYDIVAEAFRRLAHRRDLWQREGENKELAILRLQRDLVIRAVSDTYQFTVGLENSTPEGLAKVINAVVDEYIETTKRETVFGAQKRISELASERSQLKTEIERDLDRRAQISQLLGVSVFSNNFPNLYDRILVGIKQALARARQERFAAESAAASFVATENPEADVAVASYARADASKDASFTSIQSDLNRRKAELIGKRSSLSNKHPGWIAIDVELRENKRVLRETYEALVDQRKSVLIGQRRAVAFEKTRLEKLLEQEVAQQAAQASSYTALYQEALQLGLDVERARRRLDAVEDRLDFLNLEAQAPGFVRIFSRARTPIFPIRGGRLKYALMVLFGACLLGVAIPTARDFWDTRVHSIEDLEGFLGIPAMGEVGDFAHSATDRVRDQVRRIAAILEHQCGDVESAVVAFTAAQRGMGSTTITLRVTQELERMGVRVAATEANALNRDPRFKTEGVNSRVSLFGQGGEADGPYLANLNDAPRQLRAIAENLDLLLVDAPPLSDSADADFLVRKADCLVIVVEAHRTTKDTLRHLRDRIQRIQPRRLGVILTRVRAQDAPLLRALRSMARLVRGTAKLRVRLRPA